MRGTTYHKTLGIARNATISEIKRAYRRLALRYHPDRTHNEPNATAKFKEINQAYEVLSQGSQRKEYDRRCDHDDCETEDESSDEFEYRTCSSFNPCGPFYSYSDYSDYYYYRYSASSNPGTSGSSSSQKSSSSKDKSTAKQTSYGRKTQHRLDPYSFRWNASFVLYFAGSTNTDCNSSQRSGFGWTIYECDANGNPTSPNPIHEGKGSFSRGTNNNTLQEEEAASFRGLLDALEYFHKYLSCESYYIKGDSVLSINRIKKSMKDWDGLLPMDGDEDRCTDEEDHDDGYYHQRSIRLLKKISSAWRRFESVKRSQNERAVQNAMDALSPSS